MAIKHLMNLLLSPFMNALIVFGLNQCNSLLFSLPLHLFVKTNFPFLHLPFFLPFPLPSSSLLLPLLASLHPSLPIFSPFSKRLLSTYHMPGDIQEVYTWTRLWFSFPKSHSCSLWENRHVGAQSWYNDMFMLLCKDFYQFLCLQNKFLPFILEPFTP